MQLTADLLHDVCWEGLFKTLTGLSRYAALIPSGQTPDWAQTPGGLRVEMGLIWHHLDL